MDYQEIKRYLANENPSKKAGVEVCFGVITKIAFRLLEKEYSFQEVADIVGCDTNELLAIMLVANDTYDLSRINEGFFKSENKEEE